MGKRPSPRKRAAPARKAKSVKFRKVMKAIEDEEVPNKEFGQLNEDGTANIDPEKLEELKEKLGAAAWSKVRFVALNAPFKRRSPIPPA